MSSNGNKNQNVAGTSHQYNQSYLDDDTVAAQVGGNPGAGERPGGRRWHTPCCDSDLHTAGHVDMHNQPWDVQNCDTVSVVQYVWRSYCQCSHDPRSITFLHISQLLSQYHKTCFFFLLSCCIFFIVCLMFLFLF